MSARAATAEHRLEWRDRLRFAVALAETQRAHDELFGRGASAAFDRARDRVVAAIDDALHDGVSEAEVDAALSTARAGER